MMYFYNVQRSLLVAYFVSILTGAANVSRAPRNIVYLSNTTVIITCEVSENDFSYIDWSHEYRNSSWTQRLSNNTGGNASTNYLMIKTTNGENLVIDSIRLRDAGVYYCKMTTTTGMLKEVGGHVIVLASDPTCDVENVTVMEDSYMRLRCDVTFGGLWRPVMEWTQFGLIDQEKINNDSIIISAPESQQYTNMTVSLQILAKPHHNGISLVCTTYFDRNDMPVNHKVNNNTPDYNHTWKSPKISVLYGPKSVSIYPARDILYPGDILACSAMGNPEPQYKWTNNETVYNNVGSQIDIVQSMVSDHRYVFICEARNSVSESFANIRFTVRRRYPPIFFAIVAICLFCTLLLIGITFAISKYSKGPCVQGIRADPALTKEHSEIQVAAATGQPHVRVEPIINEGVSSAAYEEMHDIDISTRHQLAEEPSSHYEELRERIPVQTVYERLRAL